MKYKLPGQVKSLEQRILRAGFIVGIAHVLFKIAGLIQARVMGQTLTRETYDVTYAFAFENCVFGLFLIFEEVIGPACMPIFMREKDERGESAAWHFANVLLTFQIFVIVPLIAILMIFPSFVVKIWTSWTPAENPELFAAGIKSVRFLAPALLGFSLGSTTYVILNGYKRFFLAAFGDAVWKFTVVIVLLFSVKVFNNSDTGQALIWGLVAGSLLKLGTHFVGLRDKFGYLRLSFDWNCPPMRRLLWLALPLLAGIIFAKVRDAVNNVKILSALDSSGLLQANSMGRKLYGTIHWLVPYTLSIAAFPFFCELVDRNDHKKLGEVLTQSGRMLLAVFVPLVAVIAVIAVPLTSLTFRGGEFDALAVSRTSVSLACYTMILPGAAVEALAMQAFFANRRMLSVTVAGILFSSLSVGISWLGLKLFREHELLLLAVIAGGFALSRTLKTVMLVLLLRKNTPVFPLWPTLTFLARLLLMALIAAICAWSGLRCLKLNVVADFMPPSQALADLIRLCVGSFAGLCGAIIASYFLRIKEPFEIANWLLKKLKIRR